jgi:hypothetical protein
MECFSKDIVEGSDPYLTMKELNILLESVLDKHAPLHKIVIRHDKKPSDWYCLVADILPELKRERRRAERRWKKEPLTVTKQIYDMAKERVSNVIHDAMVSFYSAKITACSSCKELFSAVACLVGKNNASPLPSVPEPKQLPTAFSSYFKDKILTLRQAFTPSDPVTEPSTTFSGAPFSRFSVVSETDVKELILSVPPKSSEADPIPSKLVVENLNVLISVITNIFNQSLIDGVFPSEFKSAVVKPLLKKAGLDPNDFRNYRPVSNLPFLSKILEKLVLRQLVAHLSQFSLLSEHQSAYRPNHSTETVLLSVFNNLLDALDKNQAILLLLLDLSAAFDTIDHDLLLHRLQFQFGITGTPLAWIQSYLTERSQSVHIGDLRSPSVGLDFGVPQGSVLGPVLFIIYTTPLTKVIEKFSVHHEMFADDTQLMRAEDPERFENLIETLDNCVCDVAGWMNENKLKLNPKKTEAVLFKHTIPSNADKIALLPKSMVLNSVDIPLSNGSLNLGFWFDEDLSMKQHVKNIRKQAYAQIRRISSIRQFLTEDATKKLVCACVLSKLDYCNSLLVGCSKSTLNGLQLVQNDAARLVYRARRTQHVTPFLRDLHWLPVEQRLKYKICCIFYNIFADNAPKYLSNRVSKYVPQRSLRSANEHKFEKAPRYTREDHGGRSLPVLADKIWNKLPRYLRMSPSVESFKANLKTYLFDEAYN